MEILVRKLREAARSPELSPEVSLVAAVIEQALLDLSIQQYQKSAEVFLNSKDFEDFCSWLDWDALKLRAPCIPHETKRKKGNVNSCGLLSLVA